MLFAFGVFKDVSAANILYVCLISADGRRVVSMDVHVWQFFFLDFCKTHAFYSLTIHTQKKNKQSHIGTYNTQQMHLFVQNWRIMDKEKKKLKKLYPTLRQIRFSMFP